MDFEKLENMDNFIDNYFNKRQKTIEKVSSNEYLDWLVEFIDKNGNFNDDTYLYNKEIDPNDRENTLLISYLQSVIEEKSINQLALPTEDEDGEYIYYFKLKGNFYYIFTIVGQGALTCIYKLNEEPKNDYVFLDEEIPQDVLKERELIEYIVVNKDLNISASKLGVHIGHACTIAAINEQHTNKFKLWYEEGQVQKKIILGAHTKKMEELEKEFYSVRDLGLTEVEPNTLIAISLGIKNRKEAKKYIKGLQLYKL